MKHTPHRDLLLVAIKGIPQVVITALKHTPGFGSRVASMLYLGAVVSTAGPKSDVPDATAELNMPSIVS